MGSQLGPVLQMDRHLTRSRMVYHGHCVPPQSYGHQRMQRRCVDDYEMAQKLETESDLLIEGEVIVVSIWVLKLECEWLGSLERLEGNHFLGGWSDKMLVFTWKDNLVGTTAAETS